MVRLTNIVVTAPTAGVRAVTVVHCAGGQPRRALVAAGGDVLQADETAIGQHLEIKLYRGG